MKEKHMSTAPLGIGLVGYGYWGPNLARNFAECAATRLLHIADRLPERREAAQRRYPAAIATADEKAMLRDPQVEAVAIATPTKYHFDFAMRALAAGKHVLVEKPLAASSQEARALVEEADRRGLTLMVDHTFIYTAAVRHLRALIDAGELGDVLYYDSTRINLGLFQHDVDVIWDLAVHDISILVYLLNERPHTVSAAGQAHIPRSPHNIAFMTLFFPSGLIAHVNVNWLAPVKIRRTIIGGSRKMVVYDDLDPSEKIKIYDKGIEIADDPRRVQQMRVGYRLGDMHAPNLATGEALSEVVQHFAHSVRTGEKPETDGARGSLIVQILEAASRSASMNGNPVPLVERELKVA
jgi:predicted dehydrogenase